MKVKKIQVLVTLRQWLKVQYRKSLVVILVMNNVKHAIFLFGIITTFNLPAKIFSGRENFALEKIGIYYINMLAHLNFKIKRQHFGTIKLPLG